MKMPRNRASFSLRTPTSRSRLEPRRQPYWESLQHGYSIGYRRSDTGGSWIAKVVTDEIRKEKRIGGSDDQTDGRRIASNGDDVLSYREAVNKAWEWFNWIQYPEERIDIDAYKVADAVNEYMEDYAKRGKAEKTMRYSVKCNILEPLGALKVRSLTRKKISDWHHGIATSSARVRSGRSQNFKASNTADAQRKRRSTANRILNNFKAILNFAAREHGFDDREWRAVKPFKGVDHAKVRFLNDAEIIRLANASQEPFRSLLVAALVTGARYGELSRMRVSDFDSDNGSVFIAESKSGKPRHVILTNEGKRHFEKVSRNKVSEDLIFVRETGNAWKKSEQARPLLEACKASKIEPAIGFHILRHTYASRLAIKAVPMMVIAKQLGHADTRMVEKHYAHLNQSYVKDTVRQAFTAIGLVDADNVIGLSEARR